MIKTLVPLQSHFFLHAQLNLQKFALFKSTMEQVKCNEKRNWVSVLRLHVRHP